MSDLNDLERNILRVALNGEGRALEQLRDQLGSLSAERRDFTGVGFFTKFRPLDKNLRVSERDFEITDIEGATTSLKDGFGCVIFIRRGQIDLVECFTYDEPWPSDLEQFQLSVAENPRKIFDNFIF